MPRTQIPVTQLSDAALRVQCRSLGAIRTVEIGTQFPDRPVAEVGSGCHPWF
jgi:hypothetical protein